MGYYITGHGQLKVKAEDLDKAYQAMLTLQDRNDLKSGGSWSGGQEIEKWYSWMPADLRTIPSAAEIFRALGFELDEGDDGITIYSYDSKIGDERHFFAAAAPYIQGEFDWTGEDGEFWRWTFHSGRMMEAFGVKAYDHAQYVNVPERRDA
jgi:hypothetical protein